jgi:hypothetical protein
MEAGPSARPNPLAVPSGADERRAKRGDRVRWTATVLHTVIASALLCSVRNPHDESRNRTIAIHDRGVSAQRHVRAQLAARESLVQTRAKYISLGVWGLLQRRRPFKAFKGHSRYRRRATTD